MHNLTLGLNFRKLFSEFKNRLLNFMNEIRESEALPQKTWVYHTLMHNRNIKVIL